MNELSPNARRLLLRAATPALDEDRKERLWTVICSESGLSALTLSDAASTGRESGGGTVGGGTVDGGTVGSPTGSSGFVLASGYRARWRAMGRQLLRWVYVVRFALPLWGWGIGAALAAGATWLAVSALHVAPKSLTLPPPLTTNNAATAADHRPLPKAPSSNDSPNSSELAPAASGMPQPSAFSVATELPAPADPRLRIEREPEAAKLSQEVASLDRVYRALDAGLHADALRLLQQHLRAFPAPVLQQEAEAARLIARCGMNRDARSIELATTFLKRLGQSPLSTRVRRACTEPQASAASSAHVLVAPPVSSKGGAR